VWAGRKFLGACAPDSPIAIHTVCYIAFYRNLLDGANPSLYDKFPAKECANGETRPPT
jgi:hypothetical protein